MILAGHLKWETLSVVSYGLALLLINGIVWISARKYKDWK